MDLGVKGGYFAFTQYETGSISKLNLVSKILLIYRGLICCIASRSWSNSVAHACHEEGHFMIVRDDVCMF